MSNESGPSLPIEPHLGEICRLLERSGSLVLVAPPGAGKSTRLPPLLAARLGRVILLQPRRVAARALARRIAGEQGWTLGREVGWQIRLDRRYSADTRLLVATEGILTRRLQSDPLLQGFECVILDEFHERSLHADLALGLLRECRRARPELRLVVMSATLDGEALAEYLDGCPCYRLEDRQHQLELDYAPELEPAGAVRRMLADSSGHLLCFLPGVAEIRRTAAALEGSLPGARVLELHGRQPPERQEAALAPSRRRKVILATNVAETSLTVPGVTAVVDSGLHRVLRHDPDTALDRLETERIPLSSAEQRAGRAAREGPGRVLRLWHPHDRLRPRLEPEVMRVDLAGALLELLAWGACPESFAWLDAPPAERVSAGLALLEQLGALCDGRLSATGERLRELPLNPRLGRVLLSARGDRRTAAVCALLGERDLLEPGVEPATTDNDLLLRLDLLPSAPERLRRAVHELERLCGSLLQPGGEPLDDAELRRALLSGYPDRVAQRRPAGTERLLLCSGHGARLSRRSGVRQGELLLALSLTGGRLEGVDQALVHLACRVEPEWLEGVELRLRHEWDPRRGAVRAYRERRYGALVLDSTSVPPESEQSRRLVLEALQRDGPGETAEQLWRRARFAGLELGRQQFLERLSLGVRSLAEIRVQAALLPQERERVERLAPERLQVPSGRQLRLRYREDGQVVLAVKLQELFGLERTPLLGPHRRPLLLELLAPNMRPIQLTSDLESFWRRTYPEVRRELRGRYPKHPWPEDPLSATPRAGVERRRR